MKKNYLMLFCAACCISACGGGGSSDGATSGETTATVTSLVATASRTTAQTSGTSATSQSSEAAQYGQDANNRGRQTINASGMNIRVATGSGVDSVPEPAGPFFDITAYGAVADGNAVNNQTAINAAITAASEAGGGTVLIPAGTFKTYTIHLASNVGLHFESQDSILRAAIAGTDGGYYDAAEANIFVGLQDMGHSHFNNSLIVGVDVENVMISGPGTIDGSYINSDGLTTTVLTESDPSEVTNRTSALSRGKANKAIAIKGGENIVFSGFNILYGGHFAILGTDIRKWTIDGLVIDSNRDGIDIDGSQDVTVRNTTVNTVRDDSIVLKASFPEGKFVETRNVLIENCKVSGYDTGSVLAGVYSTNRMGPDVGPIGRIKLGTEATGGFDTVTIRNVAFDRARGFAIETVDGARLRNIIFKDATMKNVSSSPIYIALGDRNRAPVTGITDSESLTPTNTVRLDDLGWVLPNLTEKYGSFPAVRYMPRYNRSSTTFKVGGGSTYYIADPTAPTVLNPYAVYPDDPLYANAIGVGFATLQNVLISNVKIEDVDPRFPIIIAGLVDHPVQNVTIENVQVAYRGGLTLQDAADNRQFTKSHSYTPYLGSATTESLAWSSGYGNQFELLLPRIGWNATSGAWENDPYNVPESPRMYPEPSAFGILPAYGLYARHVQGLTVRNVAFTFGIGDERPAVVLDDVQNASFTAFRADRTSGVADFVFVTDKFKRTVHHELVLEEPYRTTRVSGVSTPRNMTVENVTIARPAPGTPPDTLYTYPTTPSTAYPYSYAVSNGSYSRPSTVWPDL